MFVHDTTEVEDVKAEHDVVTNQYERAEEEVTNPLTAPKLPRRASSSSSGAGSFLRQKRNSASSSNGTGGGAGEGSLLGVGSSSSEAGSSSSPFSPNPPSALSAIDVERMKHQQHSSPLYEDAEKKSALRNFQNQMTKKTSLTSLPSAKRLSLTSGGAVNPALFSASSNSSVVSDAQAAMVGLELAKQAGISTTTEGGQRVMQSIRKNAQSMGIDKIHYIIEVWKKYDVDESGSIDHDEVEKIVKDLGIAVTPMEVEWLMEALDEDGSGTIEFDEFAALFAEDDVEDDKKLREIKNRIQTVSRTMLTDSSANAAISTEEQKQEDVQTRVAQHVGVYMHPVLLLYCWYTASYVCYDLAVGETEIKPLSYILFNFFFDFVFIAWVALKMVFLPSDNKGISVYSTQEILSTRWRSVEFWIDCVAVFPLNWIGMGLHLNGTAGGMSAEYNGYFNINKLLLLYYTKQLYHSITRSIDPSFARGLFSMMYLFMFGHLFACIGIAATRSIGEEDMESELGTDTLLSNQDTKYLKALYWSILTLAGQIQSDGVPVLDRQLYLMMCAVLVSLPMYTIVLTSVGSAFAVEDSYTDYLNKIDNFRSYSAYVGLSKELERRAVNYFQHVFASTGSLDIHNNPLEDLPAELHIRLVVRQGAQLLSAVPIFKEAVKNVEFIFELTSKLVPMVTEPLVPVVTKGEKGRCMYFITWGTFHVLGDDQVTRVFELRRGNFFGEIALLHQVKRTATVLCGEKFGNVLVLEKRDFDEVAANFVEQLEQVHLAAFDRIKTVLETEQDAEDAAELRESLERSQSQFLSRQASTVVASSASDTHHVSTHNDIEEVDMVVDGAHVEKEDIEAAAEQPQARPKTVYRNGEQLSSNRENCWSPIGEMAERDHQEWQRRQEKKEGEEKQDVK